jgi:hypothetical protein
MNDFCADIGYKSINHDGEILCGDHVDIVDKTIILQLLFWLMDLAAG